MSFQEYIKLVWYSLKEEEISSDYLWEIFQEISSSELKYYDFH